MRLQKSPRTWPSSAEIDTESDVNDAEPLLSDASVSSRRSFGATLMFPDASETSDVDSTRPTTSKSVRSPYFLQSFSNLQKDDKDKNTAGLSRFHYYSTLKNFIRREDTLQTIPDHVVPSSVFVPYLPGADQMSGKQNSIVTIFAIWNTILGSSLLTMPWGIDRAGLLTGIGIILLMGALCLYTAYLLLRVQQLHGGGNADWEVSDLAGALLGRQSERLAKTFSLVVLLGANIVYWILMSNFLYHTVDYLYGTATGAANWPDWNNASLPVVLCPRNSSLPTNDLSFGKDSPDSIYHKIWSLEVTVPLFLIILIGPLVNFKSATFFTKFNSLGTLSVLYLVCFVIIKSSGWGIHLDMVDESSTWYSPNFSWSYPALTGMLALALFIHNIIITIMRNNRHQEKNARDLSIAFMLVVVTYLTVGVVFYISFPLNKHCIQDNLLDNFQNWDPLTVGARLFLFFQLVTVYPLIAYMLRVQVFTTFLNKVYPGMRHVVVLNTLIISICCLFAIFLPRIGTIIRFTGALSGFVYIFTLPGLLHLASLQKRGKLTCRSILFHAAITVFGFINVVAQFFVTEQARPA